LGPGGAEGGILRLLAYRPSGRYAGGFGIPSALSGPFVAHGSSTPVSYPLTRHRAPSQGPHATSRGETGTTGPCPRELSHRAALVASTQEYPGPSGYSTLRRLSPHPEAGRRRFVSMVVLIWTAGVGERALSNDQCQPPRHGRAGRELQWVFPNHWRDRYGYRLQPQVATTQSVFAPFRIGFHVRARFVG
jgi:hypothetical protein